MRKTAVLNVLETAPESVVDEVYHYALFLRTQDNKPIRSSAKTSRCEMVKALHGSIKYKGSADDIRAERLGLL
ncbi:hypothetical protein ACYULU_11260 [Breznakiellaceae bacterium SP9]